MADWRILRDPVGLHVTGEIVSRSDAAISLPPYRGRDTYGLTGRALSVTIIRCSYVPVRAVQGGDRSNIRPREVMPGRV